MNPDLYTRSMLTIIAIALASIAVCAITVLVMILCLR